MARGHAITPIVKDPPEQHGLGTRPPWGVTSVAAAPVDMISRGAAIVIEAPAKDATGRRISVLVVLACDRATVPYCAHLSAPAHGRASIYRSSC
jgi:hypothetical protein